VSPFAVSHGRLPVFPLLAAVPSGGPAPLAGVLGALALALAVGGVIHSVLPRSTSWVRHLSDCAVASAGVGGVLAVLAAFAAGGIGAGAFRHVGAAWWAVGFGSAMLSLFGSAVWIGASLLRPRAAAIEAATIQRVRLHSVRGGNDDDQPADASSGTAAERRRNAS
jgi:hypothetical protein